MVTTLYIDFSDAQGQITPESVVGSGRNTNSFKLFAASAKMIFLKTAEKRDNMIFPILSTLDFFNAQGQLAP